jgi:hypothetical protein
MARAFVASVPLAIVVVAALVVPLMVIPGTFSFQGWPKSLGGKVSEHQVELAPAPRTVVVSKLHARPTGHRAVSKTPLPAARKHATAAPTPGSPSTTPTRTLHGHRSTPVVQAPSGRGPGGRSHEAPSATPSTPSGTPQAPPEQPAPTPSTVPAPGTVASDAPPIARDDPTDNPVVTPPPAPVEEVVRDEPELPAAPAPSAPPCGSEHGHGRGNGHDNGLHLGLSLGHGHGHGGDHH